MKTTQAMADFLNALTEVVGFYGQACGSLRVSNLSLDSRSIQAGDGFVALQGQVQHGLDYLPSVLDARVHCIISDRPLNENEQACCEACSNPPVVMVVAGLNRFLGQLGDWFYDSPSRLIKVIGITGTNGKTSCAHYVAQLLLASGQTPALIGTLGNGVIQYSLDELKATANTTPDAIMVQRLLSEFRQQGANWVVMEVSSHALELGRIEKLSFECVALTQIGRDHLDFHGSEQAYHAAKAKLFTDYDSRFQVLNNCDSLGQKLKAVLPNALLYEDCSQTVIEGQEQCRDELPGNLQCQRSDLKLEGMELELVFETAHCRTDVPLMGRFNVENVLCAVGIMKACGFDWPTCCQALGKLRPVKGRMQIVASHPTVIVDFAHTAEALQHVLTAIRQHLGGEEAGSGGGDLWVVFGCGGDRDTGKRPLMAKVAEDGADKVVLTSDNPRYEDPQAIAQQVMAGFVKPQEIKVLLDRKQAIQKVMRSAKPEDLVLIAGKGHEAYQDIEGVKQPFSDEQVVMDWLRQNRDGV